MIISGITPPYAINIQKKIGKASDVRAPGRYGISKYGLGGYGITPDNLFQACLGIYQMRKTYLGRVPIKMKFYSPGPPTAPTQIAAQDKLRTAVTNWQGFTLDQKAWYRGRASGTGLSGYNLYVKEFIKNN